MTTMRLVPDTGDELPSQQIAKRIRGVMAENLITGKDLAKAIGLDQTAFSRRYSGKIDWSIDEVARVADALGIAFADLIAIRPTATPETTKPAGGTTFLPTGELSSAPSGTRTPNPLIKSQRRHLRAVQDEVPSATVVPIAGRPRPLPVRPALDVLQGGAA